MIILDTNLVSEPMKPRADPRVLEWLDRQNGEAFYLTSVSLGQLLLGVEKMPMGQQRAHLGAKLDAFLSSLFGPRILSFDREAAKAYATLMARARAAGRAIATGDGQIAAIATVHGFAVATRDVAPFVAAGVEVINPWEFNA